MSVAAALGVREGAMRSPLSALGTALGADPPMAPLPAVCGTDRARGRVVMVTLSWARGPRARGHAQRMRARALLASVSLRHRSSGGAYVRWVQGADEMALICGDNAAEPFVHLGRDTQPDRSLDTEVVPLPDAHPNRGAESACQSGKQRHEDGANQPSSTPRRGVYYELTARRRGIAGGQT